MVAYCSWTAISIDPTAVIASDKTSATTFHIADSITWTAFGARRRWVVMATTLIESGTGECRDGGNERDKTEEDGTHCV